MIRGRGSKTELFIAVILSVVIGEQRALVSQAVDVGRLVAHHAQVISADVEVTNVVTEDD